MHDKELVEKLNEHPVLRARVIHLLDIIENSMGETTLANEAERRVIEELRGMGQEALQNWACRQELKVTSEARKINPDLRKHVKKKSSGTPPME